MIAVKKRPFKIWSKGRSFDPNLSRFNSFVFEQDIPVFLSQSYANLFNHANLVKRTILRSCAYAYLTKEAIEAFRRVISPHFRKKRNKSGRSRFHIRCYPHLPLIKKPSEVRMGGGKGNKLRTHVCPIRPGQILFEISFRPTLWARKLLRRASRKLNFPVRISVV